MLKTVEGRLFTTQNFFAMRHKQTFFSEIRLAGEISTFLWKNTPTTTTSEYNLCENATKTKDLRNSFFTPPFALTELSPKVQ
jgi:hypothetical protein